MTERQKVFADFYLTNGNNATQAAKAAGYSERTAYSQGQRLLKNVEIAKYIRAEQERADTDRAADADGLRAFWSDVMRDGSEKINNRLKASELLAKSYGMFTQQITVEEKTADDTRSDVIILSKEDFERFDRGEAVPGVSHDGKTKIILPEIEPLEDCEYCEEAQKPGVAIILPDDERNPGLYK